MSKQENIYDLAYLQKYTFYFWPISLLNSAAKLSWLTPGGLREIFLRKVSYSQGPTAEEIKTAAEITTDAVLERALDRKETRGHLRFK